MDSVTVIQGTISALGYYEDNIYIPEPDCYDTLRDLIRFIRSDDRLFTAKRLCGERNIVENDLVPLVKTVNDEQMFDVCIRLMANLCQPTMISMGGKKPADMEQWQIYWNLEANIMRNKVAFADVEFFKVLRKKLDCYFLETEWEERVPEQRLLVERIFLLLRYVFFVGNQTGNNASGSDCIIMDRVYKAFLESGITQVLSVIGGSARERDFHLHVLDIYALILKVQSPERVVASLSEQAEKVRHDPLREVVENEQERMDALRRKAMAARHSRFAGSYVVKGLNGVKEDVEMLLTRPVADVSSIDFQASRKAKKRTPRNRRVAEETIKYESSYELRKLIFKAVEELLESGFQRMMRSCKHQAFNGRSSPNHNSDLHYLVLCAFVLEFVRLTNKHKEVIMDCVSRDWVHFVHGIIDESLENLSLDKKRAREHGARVHHATCVYRQLVILLSVFLEKGSVEEKSVAASVCDHLFQVEEYRDLGVHLLRRFVPGALSKEFLREVVLCTHVYIRLVEKNAKAGSLKSVMKKERKRKQKKKKQITDAADEANKKTDKLSKDEVALKWQECEEALRSVVENNEEYFFETLTPLNSLLQVDDQKHQQFLMLKIQRNLRQGELREGFSLYHAGRELWPTDGVFGTAEMTADEELQELKAIFETDLSDVAKSLVLAEASADVAADSDSEEDDEEQGHRYEVTEVEFNFGEYVIKYARASVLKWYIFLLADWKQNSVLLNKALVKMMHRVVFDLKEPSRLYQFSFFRILMQVKEFLNPLTPEKRKISPCFELYTFGFHFLKKFFACYAQLGNRLVPECLFLKGPKECYEIDHGYGTYEDRIAGQKGAGTWPEDLEDELSGLYRDYRDLDTRPEGIDVLDFIEHNLSSARTRRQIFRKLKDLSLDSLGARVAKPSLREFPLFETRDLIAKWNEMDEQAQRGNDLVMFIQDGLMKSHNKHFSRAKIIKEISYLGVVCEGGGRKGAKQRPWSEGLMNELNALYDQYKDEKEAGETSADVVNYVRIRLSEKRPRKAVEEKLRELGAEIQRREPKKRAQKKKEEGEKSDNGEGSERDDEWDEDEERGVTTDEEGEEHAKQSPWSKDLMNELRVLYDQYKEAGDTSDIADYVRIRLAEKRSRKAVENKLRELGAEIQPREPKKRAQKKKEEGEKSDNGEGRDRERDDEGEEERGETTDEEEEEQSDVYSSEDGDGVDMGKETIPLDRVGEDDHELPPLVLSEEGKEGNTDMTELSVPGDRNTSSKKKGRPDGGEMKKRATKKKWDMNDFSTTHTRSDEERDSERGESNSPEATVAPSKRKRILMDDEDDDEVIEERQRDGESDDQKMEEVEEEERARVQAPKKRRVVLSDSDED